MSSHDLNPDITFSEARDEALIRAFNIVGSIVDNTSLEIATVNPFMADEKGLTINLSGYNRRAEEDERYYVTFTWEELIGIDNDIPTLAKSRWEEAKLDAMSEAEKAKEREEENRKRAALRAAAEAEARRESNERAELARLKAKYERNEG